MTRTQLTAIAGITLIVAYSAIMIATSGATAYAWLILAAGIALPATAGRRMTAAKEDGRDE
jgi:hypothetical protein